MGDSLKMLGVLIGTGLCVGPGMAHVPIFSDGSARNADLAILIDDVTVSRVVYHEVTDGSEQIWLQFDVDAGQELTFRLGVPFIERLRDFRASLAVIGPGLPEVELPFEVPAGSGGFLFSTDSVADPEFFQEEFTGTDSWILGDFPVAFPQSGRYYAVAFVPPGETGKLWVALGDREVFVLADILGLPQIIRRVRAFHEVPETNVPCFAPVLGAGVLILGVASVARGCGRILRK